MHYVARGALSHQARNSPKLFKFSNIILVKYNSSYINHWRQFIFTIFQSQGRIGVLKGESLVLKPWEWTDSARDAYKWRAVHRERVKHWALVASVFLHARDAYRVRGALGMRAAHRALRPENFTPSPKFIPKRLIHLQVSYSRLLIDSWICYGVSNEERTSFWCGEH